MKDFVAVLSKFKQLGRYGLSQQALSEICGRAISFEELTDNPGVSVFFCGQAGALLFRGTVANNNSPPLPLCDRLGKHLEEEFPWPKFKGICELKGQRTTGLRPSTLAALREAARKAKTRRGKVNEW